MYRHLECALQVRDLDPQAVQLLVQSSSLTAGHPAELHVEDRDRLSLIEVVLSSEKLNGLVGIRGPLHDREHLLWAGSSTDDRAHDVLSFTGVLKVVLGRFLGSHEPNHNDELQRV